MKRVFSSPLKCCNLNDHISFYLGRDQSSDHISGVNCQKKKHFACKQLIRSQDFMKKSKFDKNVQNLTYKPNTCLNSGESIINAAF